MMILKFEGASYHYPDDAQLVLRELTFSVGPGEIVRIVGRNGSGKTTLLRLATGELEPTSGRVLRAGGANAVYLDQFSMEMLAPDMTLAEHGRAFAADDAAPLENFLERFGLGLELRLQAFAGELSGGQRQILAFILVLLRNVSLLCLDEFTANLDPKSEATALEMLAEYQQVSRATILFVAHKALPLVPTRNLDLSPAFSTT